MFAWLRGDKPRAQIGLGNSDHSSIRFFRTNTLVIVYSVDPTAITMETIVGDRELVFQTRRPVLPIVFIGRATDL
jgi:hypothetical protein